VREKAGCFAIVLEKIPATLASKTAEEISIPIIVIGAGGGVDGQVLVLHDMLGLNVGFNPRFLRRYLNLFDDKINFTADVYRKVTFDLLLNALLPPSSGFSTSYKNIGKVENKGLELSLTTKNISTDDFSCRKR
jgi:hypothetical protein